METAEIRVTPELIEWGAGATIEEATVELTGARRVSDGIYEAARLIIDACGKKYIIAPEGDRLRIIELRA